MKKFRITLECDMTLDEAALWPDGDAPDSPTTADVYDLIKPCGGPNSIVRDWDMDLDVYVSEEKP